MREPGGALPWWARAGGLLAALELILLPGTLPAAAAPPPPEAPPAAEQPPPEAPPAAEQAPPETPPAAEQAPPEAPPAAEQSPPAPPTATEERAPRRRRREAGAEPRPPAAERPDRIAFELPVPAEEGGGTISGTAGSLEFVRSDYAVLAAGVEVRYQDLVLTAERAEIDLAQRVVKAEGDVVLDQGPRRLTGSTVTFDLDAKTGTLTEATAFVEPDYYFSGKEISKVGPDTYTVVDGRFTSCSDAVPDWSFRLRRARVTVEGYARVRNAAMRVKKVPVFFTPYLLWPAKTERASGFLVPQPGYSDRRGGSLSLAYYQTLGPSWDTTLFTDLYSEQGFLGVGNEVRYRPTEGTEGIFEGYAVQDPERDDDWRWQVRLDHTSENLPLGLRAVLQYRDFSDFDYYRDYERDFSRGSLRSLFSRGFITGNWGQHSLNLLAENRETLVTDDNVVIQRRLPEAEYRLRPTRLGSTPLYLEVEGALGYFDLRRSATYDGDYGRLDLFPTLTLPVRAWPWLSLSLTVGERLTWWGDSLCLAGVEGEAACPTAAQEFTGRDLSRSFPVVGAEIIGPSFSRIFSRQVGIFDKFKHVIEPRWTYSFQGDVDEETNLQAPLFDEIDIASSRNIGRFALVNRLLAKPAERPAEEGEKGPAEAAAGGAAVRSEEGEVGDVDEEGGGAAAAETEDGAAAKAEEAAAEEAGGAAAKASAEVEEEAEGEATGDGEAEGEAEAEAAAAAEEPRRLPPVVGGSREIASFEISQAVSFDRDQPLQQSGELKKQEGPISALLRINPSPALNLQAQLNYSTLFDRLTSRSLSGAVVLPGNNRVGLTWFTRFRAEDGETVGDQLRVFTNTNPWPGRLRLGAEFNYDLEQSLLQQQRYIVDYTSQCFSWRLEYRDFRAGLIRDRDYRFSLTLKNVGTFLDLTGRQSTSEGF